MSNKIAGNIDLMDLLSIFWRRKIVVFIVMLLSIISVSICTAFFQKKEIRTEIVVSLDFEGIENGHYPDGSVFQKADIVSPRVIGKHNYSDIDLPETLKVEDWILNKPKQKGLTYHKKKYKVIAWNDGTSSSEVINERIKNIERLFKAFIEDFKTRFVDESVVSIDYPADFIGLNEYHYMAEVFRRDIQTLEFFLTSQEKDFWKFILNNYDVKRNVMHRELEMIEKVFLNRAVDYLNIDINSFIKDRETLIGKLEHEIKKIKHKRAINKKKVEASYGLLLTIFGEGDQTEKKTVKTSPVVFNLSLLEQRSVTDSIALIIQSILDYNIKTIDCDQQIVELEKQIEMLRSRKNDDLRQKENNLIEILEAVQSKILKYSDKINGYYLEFLKQKYDETVLTYSSPVTTIHYRFDSQKAILVTIAASFFLGLSIVLLMDMVINYKKRKSKNV